MTFHADKFRDKLSTFFLTFAGAASTVVLFVLGQQATLLKYGNPDFIAGALLAGVGVLGTIILLIHARLRKVQLEQHI